MNFGTFESEQDHSTYSLYFSETSIQYYYTQQQSQQYLSQQETLTQNYIIIKYPQDEPFVRHLLENNFQSKQIEQQQNRIPFEIASSVYQSDENSSTKKSCHVGKKQLSLHQIESIIVMVPLGETGRILSSNNLQYDNYQHYLPKVEELHFITPHDSTDNFLKTYQVNNYSIDENDWLILKLNIDKFQQHLEQGNQIIDTLNKQLLDISVHVFQCMVACYRNFIEPLIDGQNRQLNVFANQIKVMEENIGADTTQMRNLNDDISNIVDKKLDSDQAQLEEMIQSISNKQRYFSQHNLHSNRDEVVKIHTADPHQQIFNDLKRFNYNPEALKRMHRRMKVGASQREEQLNKLQIAEYKASSQPETTQKQKVGPKVQDQQLSLYLNSDMMDFNDKLDTNLKLSQPSDTSGFVGCIKSNEIEKQQYSSNQSSSNSNPRMKNLLSPSIQIKKTEKDSILTKSSLNMQIKQTYGGLSPRQIELFHKFKSSEQIQMSQEKDKFKPKPKFYIKANILKQMSDIKNLVIRNAQNTNQIQLKASLIIRDVSSSRQTKLSSFLTKRHKNSIKSQSQRSKFTKTFNQLDYEYSQNYCRDKLQTSLGSPFLQKKQVANLEARRENTSHIRQQAKISIQKF